MNTPHQITGGWLHDNTNGSVDESIVDLRTQTLQATILKVALVCKGKKTETQLKLKEGLAIELCAAISADKNGVLYMIYL